MDTIHWPIAYYQKSSKVRAIVLGCDPSNQHDRALKHAFGIGTESKKLRQFFNGIESNLGMFGLSRNDVYVQNLCQNYFNVETSKNKEWMKAAKIWLPYLKEELDSLIACETPVFMSAEIIYRALLKESVKRLKAEALYSNLDLLPISSSDNYLERPLLPLFRGGRGKYNLNNGRWDSYVDYMKGDCSKKCVKVRFLKLNFAHDKN